jgi:2-methylcitrate dehydratase PrpD
MTNKDNAHPFDRRVFLAGAGALAVTGANGAALAQEGGGKPMTVPGKQLRQILAEFVVGFDLGNVPADVIERARVAFIDTIGVAVAGSHEEVSHIVAEMVKADGSAPQCTVVGQSLRASPQLAALANGVAAHAMDYDFSLLNGQSVAPVIPALLPLAEINNATPADVLGAFIIGCEVATRILRSSPRIINDGGWHSTGIVGVIAATAACARLLKLPADKTAESLGIAASLASGLPVNYGTMSKPLHAGNAARNAVMAVTLASRGFDSHAAAFEGNNGYFRNFARALPTNYDPFNDLGSRWDLTALGYDLKYYPCGGRGHTAIEAALMLRDKIGLRLNEITNIHCWMSPTSAKRVNTDYPATVEAAKFSAAYVIAYSLVHGAPKIKAFTPEALRDARVRALAGLVTSGADPNLSERFGQNPTRVKITLNDGQTFELQRDTRTGNPEQPFTPAQIEEKFMDCATQTVSADSARKLFAIVRTINQQPSFGEFWTLIRKA